VAAIALVAWFVQGSGQVSASGNVFGEEGLIEPRIPVLIVGGGPVGLSVALELNFHRIRSVLVEPRTVVSHARPRAKTTSARTMELFRRWGVADEIRLRAPLSPDYSSDIVFCTSVTGREISRFTGTLGIGIDATGLAAEGGQQVGQHVVEETLRDAVVASEYSTLLLGRRVTAVAEVGQGCVAMLEGGLDRTGQVGCDYLVGADGAHSVVRSAIGARYEGSPTGRPNLSIVFRTPRLAERIPHGRAVHYWVLNPATPGVVGPMDPARDIWWAIATGRTADDAPHAVGIVRSLIGADVDVEVLGTDPWQARSLLVDRYRRGRMFLAGDAAHQNPPWGGHGFNTGVGDAVNLGWKLAAVLNGWAPEAILDSYETERRPISRQTIDIAAQNTRTLPSDFQLPALMSSGGEFEAARGLVAERIQREKRIEFHCLGLVLGYGYGPRAAEQILGESDYQPIPAPGNRLPHGRLADGSSIFDHLGREFSVIGSTAHIAALLEAAAALGIPTDIADTDASPYGAEVVLVRPDQHIAWLGAAPKLADAHVILKQALRGFPTPTTTGPAGTRRSAVTPASDDQRREKENVSAQ
jgi:2-polyprenyl-6-methoxyphenol hydroxylase-like FAD-dependent oxidoreductase